MASTVVLLAVAVLVFCAPAVAQTNSTGRFEVAAGAGLFGGSTFGSRDANLRANDAQASPFRLFATETKLSGAPLIEAIVGYKLSRRIQVDGRLTFSRPDLRSSLNSDAESASPITATERLDHYVIEAGVAYRLEELQFGRTVPFVTGGAGYVRQLHEGLTLIDEGYDYYVGGGIAHPLVTRDRAKLKAVGIRAEARLRVVGGGVVFDSAVPRFGLSSSLFFGF